MVGRGGMGEVFEAHDTEHDRVVALKRLTAEGAGDEEYQRRFRREARLVARLSSPHVIPIHSYGEIDGQLFLDMRLVGGADLERILATEGRLPPARAVAIVEQVASALDAAHHAGLVHRDVKPSNVLVDDAVGANEFAYLVDFGITRSLGGDDSAPLTGTRVLIGSLDYMAPERFSGGGGQGIDVYALACLLYECLTGSRPFPIDEFIELMTAHLYTAPPAPSRLVPGLDEAFDAVIASGLAKDPEQRPASAGALAAAARAALDAGTGAKVPSTPTTAQWERPVLDPGTPGATRRGGTERSAASAVDAPTTAVPPRTPTASSTGASTAPSTGSSASSETTTALRPGARSSSVGAAPGPQTRSPGGQGGHGGQGGPPRSSLQAMRPGRPAGPPARGTGVRPVTGGPSAAPGGGRGAAAGAPPARSSAYESSPSLAPVRPPRPATGRVADRPPTAGLADPEPPSTKPTEAVAGGGAGRKALLIALVVLGTVLVVAAAVYIAVLLTPAAG